MRVEGVAYRINWKKFKRGASFFIPCLDDNEAKKEIQSITKRLKYEIVMRTVVEDSVKGVRIWRV
jgi:hypothetical protein